VFFTWALTITLGLILMYILANAGVVKYYLTERRSELNPFLHIVFPIVGSGAVAYVGYRSVVPLPDPPVEYAPIVLVVYLAIGAALLLYHYARGNKEWLVKAQMAMEESAGEVHPPLETTATAPRAR
jgi:amino acid transporter